MQAYSIEKVITQDGKIQLDALPFAAGETVQVIILPGKQPENQEEQAPLKGSVIAYSDPFASAIPFCT